MPVPPSAQISALLWMRHTLAIQTCIAVCAWQCARPFQHGERSDLDETRPNVDIDIPARLVGAQAKYVGLARWPAEGLLGFAYMGLTADHPTILALAESLTHQLPHVMHQHMLYLCTAVMYLKGLPATLDYEALGRRANQVGAHHVGVLCVSIDRPMCAHNVWGVPNYWSCQWHIPRTYRIQIHALKRPAHRLSAFNGTTCAEFLV